jgi:23S rRNA pseudouridine1911/1915/1917 synthase
VTRSFIVGEADAGERVDLALSAITGISRSEARRWIDDGLVRVNALACRPSQRVQLGDALEADPPEPLPSPLTPEAIPLAILWEDADVLVLDKPAGLVVHPAPGHASGTLVNALLHHCADLAGVGGVLRPGIVHRLDQGTSGVLVVAKNDFAHRALAEQFRDHSIERIYRALVRGVPAQDAGRVDRPIGRHPRERKRMSVHAHVAREAQTAWRVIARYPKSERAWLEVRPETGRTHQIRVHLASLGLPIAGDPVYGRQRAREDEPSRPALHAAVLGFVHPRSGERLRFEAPLPADLASLLDALEQVEAAR